MDKLKMHTPDLTSENIEKLATLFPDCVTEAKDEVTGKLKRTIDFDQLRQELSDHIVEGPRERYHLDWPGKREALLAANAPIAKTLRPCREESVNFDTTKNLFIEGDNLDALKLLQETYLGKVKMIYIDPPYNKDADVIYKDDFTEDTESFFRNSKQVDDFGNRLISNTEANGRFHSDWLKMLYSRIKLARNLLRDDGVLLVSIGEREAENVLKIGKELFGEKSFIASFIWHSKITGGHDSKDANSVHEFVICFGKNPERRGQFLMNLDSGTEYPEYDPVLEKTFKWDSFWTVSHGYTENCDYPIIAPDGEEIYPWMCHRDGNAVKGRARWFWSSETYSSEGDKLLVKRVGDGWKVYKRVYGGAGTPIQTLISKERVAGTASGKAEVEALFERVGIFSNPKPLSLLHIFLERVSRNSLVLDFFAGSGTTAHAVLQANAQDGGSRRFILVQLPEPCQEESEASRAGYNTIAEIAKDRIRRAGAKLRSDNATTASHLDTGFRVLKIDTSNMADVYYAPDAVKQADLVAHTDNIKPDRTPEDLLFQVLVDWGVDLSLSITQETILSKTVFFVDGNALAACFDSKVSEDLVKELAKRKPLRVVFRDSSFDTDSTKINVEQIFKLLSPETEVKSL